MGTVSEDSHTLGGRSTRFRRYRVCFPPTALSFVALHLYCASGAQRVLPCKLGWLMGSQLDLPSLTPWSVAGCGQLLATIDPVIITIIAFTCY